MALTIGEIEPSENSQTFTHLTSKENTIFMSVDDEITHVLRDGKWIEIKAI